MEGERENNNRAPSLPHAHTPCWAVDLPGANRTTRGHEGASRSRRKCAERACCFRQPKRRTTTHCARNTHARRRPEHHQRCGPIARSERDRATWHGHERTCCIYLFLVSISVVLSAHAIRHAVLAHARRCGTSVGRRSVSQERTRPRLGTRGIPKSAARRKRKVVAPLSPRTCAEKKKEN